jgi:dual specificity tyrosine-phosphorylation-regulated kinase 2/3/4
MRHAVEANAAAAEDRVRKFQKTGDQGSRLRKTSASNAISAARPLPTINNNAAGRGRAKVPLGPRERPQDFTKQRYDAAAPERYQEVTRFGQSRSADV